MAYKVDISGAMRHLEAAKGQVRFAAALALTTTAKDGQAEVTGAMSTTFDKPTRFTMNAVTIIPARKTSLQAWVIVKDRQAEYLVMQETGGTRQPRPGKPINIPVNIRTNQSGNIPRGAIKRALARPDTFVASGKTPETRHLPPGIYKRHEKPKGRTRAGTARKARRPELLVDFERQAVYRPRFRFEQRVVRVVANKWQGNFVQALQRALATAR